MSTSPPRPRLDPADHEPACAAPRSGRRAFLRALGRAGLSSALAVPALARAAQAPPPAPPAKPPVTQPPPPAGTSPAEPKPPSEDARALASIVERRYGAHLEPEDLAAVTRSIDGRLEGGARLRAARLTNADEPDVVFRAGPERG